MYFNVCNSIDNENRMWNYDIVLNKYWEKHSGYFILATTVALGMAITYGKLMYFHGVSKVNLYRKIPTL